VTVNNGPRSVAPNTGLEEKADDTLADSATSPAKPIAEENDRTEKPSAQK
jgi:hypothetical protein